MASRISCVRATLAGLTFGACAPTAMLAQSRESDSVAAHVLAPAVVNLLDDEIARAAFGHENVIRLELPSGPEWSRIGSHVLRVVNGRAPAPGDRFYTIVTVTHVRMVGDRLFADMEKAMHQVCKPGDEASTGTAYEARAEKVGRAWTHVELTPSTTWDGGCIEEPE